MNTRVEKIKKHFHENKKTYIVGGVLLVVGSVGGFAVAYYGGNDLRSQDSHVL